MKASNLTEGLAFVLRQLSQGGGGKKLTERVRAEWREKYDPEGVLSVEELRQKARDEFTDQARAQLAREGEDVSVMDVQSVMEKMQQRNREMFVVPPYILYVARAFSTLEGIGLSANEVTPPLTHAPPLTLHPSPHPSRYGLPPTPTPNPNPNLTRTTRS